jgi:hypothetical protein
VKTVTGDAKHAYCALFYTSTLFFHREGDDWLAAKRNPVEIEIE